jgi:hypothetical protein
MGKVRTAANTSVRGKGPLLMLVVVLLSPFLLIWGVLYWIWTALLYVSIWLAWGLRGRSVLLVYSDSPLWKEMFETEIWPRLSSVAVPLNWSHRKKWRPSLAVLAFMRFAGNRNFNPAVIVFRPFRRARIFRFHEAFGHFKHGNAEPVERLKRELFEFLEI